MRALIFIQIIIILMVYYIVGGESFPDYLNYITISENGGWLFDEREYFFEWFSRGWLKYMPEIVSHKIAVDFFAAFIQLAYIIWVLMARERKSLTSRYWITAFSGPLFLTTTLRGSISYLAAFLLVENRNYSKSVVGLILISGLAFHDSFALIVIAYIFSRLSYKFISRKVIAVVYFSSFLLAMFGSSIVQGIAPLILLLGIGIRDVYFLDVSDASLLKIMYAIFVGTLIFPLVRVAKSEDENLIFLVMIYFLSCGLFAISSTPAIRMLLYVSGMAITLGFKRELYPRIFKNPLFMVPFGSIIMSLMFWDLMRNANIN